MKSGLIRTITTSDHKFCSQRGHRTAGHKQRTKETQDTTLKDQLKKKSWPILSYRDIKSSYQTNGRLSSVVGRLTRKVEAGLIPQDLC